MAENGPGVVASPRPLNIQREAEEMNIVHVINGLRGGGAENLLVSLAIEMKRVGHVVQVVVVDRCESAYEAAMLDRLHKAGVETECLGRRVGSGLAGALGATWRLAYALRTKRPDVVNTHLGVSHLVVGLCKVSGIHLLGGAPIHIATVHNAPENWGWLSNRLNRRTAKIYCSESACEADITRPQKYCIIKNAARLSAVGVDPYIKRREMGFAADTKIIISVGEMRRQKNYAGAIEAVDCARTLLGPTVPVEYLICGGESKGTEDAKAAIHRLSMQRCVHLLGTRQDTRDLLEMADCYLNSSHHEGLSLAVLESLLAGLPCVLADIPSHRNLARGMPGCILTSNQDPSAMGKVLAQVLGQCPPKEELRRDRWPHLREYSLERCTDKYLAYYGQLLEEAEDNK